MSISTDEATPYCSPTGKLVTILVHCGVTAFMLAMGWDAGTKEDATLLTDVNIQLSIVHIAYLLGLCGPKPGAWRHWWSPSPLHEMLGASLFMVIGLVEFFGTAIIHFRITETTPCSSFLDGARLAAASDADLTVEAYVTMTMHEDGCTVQNGNAVGPCGPCGCDPCEAADVWAWFNAVAAPESTSVTDGFQEAMDAEGCKVNPFSDQLGVPWTFIDTLWFCCVLLTTVGYGNTFVPTTPSNRLFVLVWALYGLCIFGAASNVIADAVSMVLSTVRDAIRRAWPVSPTPVAVHAAQGAKDGRSSTDAGASATPKEEATAEFEPVAAFYVLHGLYFNLVCFLVRV